MKRALLPALTAALLLPLTACSGSDDPADAFADDERTAVEVMHAAVDATLEIETATIDTRMHMKAGFQEFKLSADSTVDYPARVGEASFRFDQQGQVTTVGLVADGEKVWVRKEGPQVPPVPDGKEWAEGGADLIGDSGFESEGMVGAVTAMLGLEEAEFGDAEERAGVPVREVTGTVRYADARAAAEAAGHDLATRFALTGQADQLDIEITAWIGEDDIVREFHILVVEEDGIPVEGTLDLSLEGVNEGIETPEAPDSDDVATGPAAEAWLSAAL